ncbi:MAG: transcriptional regulator, partial [Scardovia wiggsiae]
MTDSEDRNTVDPPSFHPSPRKISEGSPAQADSGLSAGNPADGADGSRQPAVSEPAPPSFAPSSSPSRRISRRSAEGIQA